MKRITIVLFTLILAISSIFGNAAVPLAETAETAREFDYVNVLDDLTSSSEGETAFDLTDYPYNENGRVELITLVEYCYSYAANMRDNYALYLYIYNPTGKEINTESDLNVAQFAVSYNDAGSPNDYEGFELAFCNKSTGDYNNLFYKFRVIDHESADRKTIAERVNSNSRRYDISSVEIIYIGDDLAKDYGCGGTYTYKGYAAGYGSDANAETTLECTVRDLETLDLEVMQTYYRPKGYYTNGHQDQLNSVYFAVPNDVLERYGQQISKIKSRWDEYKTGLIGVFDNATAYDIFSALAGKDMTEYSSDYALAGNYDYDAGVISSYFTHHADWVYNANDSYTPRVTADSNYDLLTAAFFANGQDASTYEVKAEEVEKALKNYSEGVDGEKINGVYSTDLFVDYVDEGRTKGENSPTIPGDYEYSLTAKVLDKDFWYYLTGLKNYEVAEYSHIKAIQEVTDADLLQTDDKLATSLYINPSDVSTFRQYCQVAEDTDKTVFLFRFAATDYYATNIHANIQLNTVPWQEVGYAAQQTVFLNFKIIQVEFYKNGNYTVIAAVQNPIDIVPGVTPPLQEETNSLGNIIAAVLRVVLFAFIIFAIIVVIVILIKSIIKASISKQAITVNVNTGQAEVQKENNDKGVKTNGSKKGSSQKTNIASKGSSKNGASTKKNGVQKSAVQTGGKTQGNNSSAKGGKTNGKAKCSQGKGTKVQSGKRSVSDKKLRGGSNAKR